MTHVFAISQSPQKAEGLIFFMEKNKSISKTDLID